MRPTVKYRFVPVVRMTAGTGILIALPSEQLCLHDHRRQPTATYGRERGEDDGGQLLPHPLRGHGH